ncbi:MAG: DUF342 domain-containing protein [Chloroflexota bacterium]
MVGEGMQGGRPSIEAAPKVTIANDGSTAFLTVPRSEEPFSDEAIKQLLEAAGVAHGVDWPQLSLLLAKNLGGEMVPVAHATPPTPGIDARIEYLFDTSSGQLKERAGRVDWRELNLVTSVQEGSAVARKHPAQPGTPGTNVRGQPLNAKPPRDVRVALGPGTVLAPDDPNTVLAAVSGAIRVDSTGRVTVDNTYVVKGDVDLASGNVDFVGSVVIQGDIKRGFVVKATGDIEVKGAVEEATIIAQGSVVVQGGILGGSTTPVQAAQDILARFANNAVLRAGHDVVLGQEALNCDIEAEGRVVVGGNPPSKGAVMGGSIRAAQEIAVYNVGSSGGQTTKLRVGYDWLLPRKLHSLEHEIQDRKTQLEKLQTGMSMLMERGQADLTPEQRLMLEKLRLTSEAERLTLHALENRRTTWMKVASAASGVSVYGTVHSGTDITVDGKNRTLVDDRVKERFVAEGGVVIGVPVRL